MPDQATVKSTGTTRGKRFYRYRVSEVWGSMEGKVAVGDVLIDERNYGPEKQWDIFDIKVGTMVGGVFGERIGTGYQCGDCPKGIFGEPHNCAPQTMAEPKCDADCPADCPAEERDR